MSIKLPNLIDPEKLIHAMAEELETAEMVRWDDDEKVYYWTNSGQILPGQIDKNYVGNPND